jgi:hypothetical protein
MENFNKNSKQNKIENKIESGKVIGPKILDQIGPVHLA